MGKDILVDIVRFWGVSRSISGAAFLAVGWCSFLCLWRNYALMGGCDATLVDATADSAEIAEGERTTGTPKAGHRPSTPYRATPGEVNEGEERREARFALLIPGCQTLPPRRIAAGGPPLESYMLMTFAPTLHRNRPR